MSIAAPELHPLPVVSPWYHIGIDFIGPISPSSQQGKKYILTISDYFTQLDQVNIEDRTNRGGVGRSEAQWAGCGMTPFAPLSRSDMALLQLFVGLICILYSSF